MGVWPVFDPAELPRGPHGLFQSTGYRRLPKKAMEIGLTLQDTAGFRFRHASGMGSMSVRVSCHKCSATLKVDDDFVGRNVICPSCRSSVRVEKPTDDRQSGGSSGTWTNESPNAKFVSVQVPAETPKKKRKGRASKRKQKARATRGRNPVRVLACLLIAGLATWFAFFRPADQQLTSVAPSQRTEAESASDPATGDAPTDIGAPSASRTVAADSRGQAPAAASDPNDRFQIIWAPRHVIRAGSTADAQ
jgi:hypothetical protein